MRGAGGKRHSPEGFPIYGKKVVSRQSRKIKGVREGRNWSGGMGKLGGTLKEKGEDGFWGKNWLFHLQLTPRGCPAKKMTQESVPCGASRGVVISRVAPKRESRGPSNWVRPRVTEVHL